MTEVHKSSSYPLVEERINIFSHGLGLILSVLALLAMTVKAQGMLQVVSVLVFSASLIALYGSSTIYHGTTNAA
ncbi:MAG: hemolysin III family protein, partial [Woeseiaceae bacterium]|nr:hemolysin III family protein [Woeseiaceae bacterium]